MTLKTQGNVSRREVDDENIVAHFRDGFLATFSKGTVIIHGYEEPQGVYLIKSGFVKAYSISPDGHSNLLMIHKKGEFIPLPWALEGVHKPGMFYEAISDVMVLRASKDNLRVAMDGNAWLAQEVLSQTVNINNVYAQRIQTLEYRSARNKVISELIHIAERFGEKRGREILINAPITHQDIADSINMSRETASRTLQLLFEEKLMGQEDHRFTVKDIGKLRRTLD